MTDSTALQNYEAQLAEEAQSIRETLSQPGTTKISTKGKMFTLPDGTTNPGPMQCVIVDYLSFNSYYEGIYDSNNPQPPVCWSINRKVAEMKPSESCPKPQAETCEACPQNQFGSAGRGKACKNSRRLLIAPVDATEDTRLMTLEVSPAAIRSFDAYITEIKDKLDTMPVRVITTIGFDPNKAYPSLVFSDPKLHDNLAVMMKLRETGQSILLREPDK